MQLDSIGGFFGIAGSAAAIVALFLGVAGAVEKSCSTTFPELAMSKREAARGAAYHRLAPRIAVVAGVLLTVNAFLPSTKTAAAMIVLPALSDIANSETVQREAGELYGIAKDALRELAKPDAPEPKE